MSLPAILVLGFLLGMKHATEADHLAAVASLACEDASRAVRQGAAWGLGHSAALLLFGGIALASDQAISPPLALALECASGLMLLLLGMDLLRRLQRSTRGDGRAEVHADESSRAGSSHGHLALFAAEPCAAPAAVERPWRAHERSLSAALPRRAVFVGAMHGMAGSAALIVLGLGAVGAPALAPLYLLCFGVGSIVGMSVLSWVLVWPLRRSRPATAWEYRGMHATVGVLSCALGLAVVLRAVQASGL